MDDLELLKQDWNKDSDEFKNYSEKELLLIIKRRTTDITKTLFVFGLIEITIWLFFNYIYGLEFPFLRYFAFALFLVLIVWSYYKFSFLKDSKSFMKDILNLRKYILGYALFTLAIIVFESVRDFKEDARDALAGFTDGKNGNPINTVNPESLEPGFITYLMFFITSIVLFYILYSIYKATYGKLLRKLKTNYTELTKMEDSNA